MIYHIVVGDMAAGPLRDAVEAEPSMQGEVVVMKDILHVGPLLRAEGQSFSNLRSTFWNRVLPYEKDPVAVDDMERLLEISSELYKDGDAQAWFWMAPWPADVCAYHWLLFYLSKHLPRFYLVSIAGLPFLNGEGKVYYPRSLSEILPRELVKARRLARPVTPAEVEIDGEEWRRLVAANDGVRSYEGGKKLKGHGEDYYDALLLAGCGTQWAKAARIIAQSIGKQAVPTGDLWLAWRLRELAASGKLALKGDPSKSLKDWELRLPESNEPVP